MKKSLIILITLVSSLSHAVYKCVPDRSIDINGSSNTDYITKYSPYTKIVASTISRCSKDSKGKNSCDDYKVDKLEHDKNVNIKKFYYFRGQFNVQIFSDLTFVEDNGRGSIYFGKCDDI